MNQQLWLPNKQIPLTTMLYTLSTVNYIVDDGNRVENKRGQHRERIAVYNTRCALMVSKRYVL